jgi:class 3 adenylate cyclase/tetratricopeptide (TPR) repeat protein
MRTPAALTAVPEGIFMRCPSCAFENPEGLKFCNDCGTPLRMPCGQCGFANQPQAKFCGECGAALPPHARASTALPVAPRPHAPLSYTPTYLAEKILTSRSALEGERKQVTVLFADLKSSMELLADRDPEDAREILDPVLERMMAAVHRYEGTVNQVMGDGIMALFGAPIAHEDHAVRACYAALAMQASVKQYAAEVQRTKGVPIQMRVGLNAGEVVVRAIGSDLHMDYTAVGQTTHLAARMEQVALPGSILITADVLRLAKGYVQVDPLGLVPIKGLQEPVAVYEVTGAGPVRSRLQAAAARGLTRFVGRDTELNTLRQALGRAGAGQGQVVAVIGEPGVGKSRLFWEFTQSHRIQGWLILESRSVSYGKATAYLPVIDLLKTYVGIETRDDARRLREKVTAKLLTLDETLMPTLPAILALLDVPVEDAAWHALDPSQRRQRTLEAVTRLLLRESQVQPLLVIVEDLHWIDTETQALLDMLVERLPTARLLLLVNYRPEYSHRWGSKTSYSQPRLDALHSDSAEALLRALLGDDGSLAPLKPRLIEQTEGNPFFLEESVRTLVETRVLVGEQGAYRLAETVPRTQVPATVQAVLAARIDRLPPGEKALLQTAAVIGTEVPLALLQAIAEVPGEPLRVGLAHLQAAEFLYETRLFPDIEYTFKHALTQQVAYETLLQERRRVLHACIVEALEHFAPDRLAEQVDRLAHHAVRGGVWDKALAYCRQAGARAADRSALREAVVCLEQALRALQHLPESRETMAQGIDLRFALRNALLPLGAFDRLLATLREAETLATALDDPRRLGWVHTHMTHYFWITRNLDRALVSGQRALALATPLDDFELYASANFCLAEVCYILGNYPQAIAALRWNVEAITGDRIRKHLGGPAILSVVSRRWLAMSLAEVGAFAEGLARGEEAIRIAEAAEHPYSLVNAYLGLSYLAVHQGDFPQAIPLLTRALELCRVWDLAQLVAGCAVALGHVLALAGRGAEGLTLLQQTVPQASLQRLIGRNTLWAIQMSETYLYAGCLEEATVLARQALDLACEQQGRGDQAYALRLLGEMAARRDPPEAEQAETYDRQALALAEELGMRPLQAHCHSGLGTLYAKLGRQEQARSELSIAIGMYRAMDMTFWLPQAEAALAQVEGRP